jgi:hypothetical protein
MCVIAQGSAHALACDQQAAHSTITAAAGTRSDMAHAAVERRDTELLATLVLDLSPSTSVCQERTAYEAGRDAPASAALLSASRCGTALNFG